MPLFYYLYQPYLKRQFILIFLILVTTSNSLALPGIPNDFKDGLTARQIVFSVLSESATTKWRDENREQKVHRCYSFIKMLDDFNEYTNKKYDKEIELAKLTWEIQMYILVQDYKELKNKKYNKYLKLLSGKDKWRALISIRYPSMVIYRRKITSLVPVN